MSYKVSLSTKAKNDLIRIYRYIADDLRSPINAERQLDRLYDSILSLDEMPERFRIYDIEKWRGHNLRVMPVNNYLVFYVSDPDKQSVTVIRILYGGQDVTDLL